MTVSPCPDRETWDRFARGGVNDSLLDAMADHLRDCSDCRGLLDDLEDTDLDLLVAPGGPAAPAAVGRFRLHECLGVGGLGAVYRAFDPDRGEDVALKLLLPHAAIDPRWRRRFLNEGGLTRLDHPHVVRVFEAGCADGVDYLAMEFCAGPSLGRWIESASGPVPARLAARVVAEVAEGAAFCHEQGVIHRDISPANVLLFPRDPSPGDEPGFGFTVKLADFGLAKGLPRAGAAEGSDSLTATGALLGKLEYLAPETLREGCRGVDPRADVFALGVLLYRLLAGRSPFRGINDAQTLRNVEMLDPPPPRAVGAEPARDVETICLKCLDKEPARRYESARDVADELRRFLDGKAIRSRPPSAREKTWRWCRRHPAVAGLAVALVAALAVGFIGMFSLWRRAEANFVRMAELLHTLVSLNAGFGSRLPEPLSVEQKISLLRVARRNLVELADRLPDRRATYGELMAVDRQLGYFLQEESRWDDWRAHCERSLRDAEEARRLIPEASGLWENWTFNTIGDLISIADRQGRDEDVLALSRRLLAFVENVHREAPTPASLLGVISARRTLSKLHVERGHREEARALLLANHRDLQEIRPEWINEEFIALRASALLFRRQLGLETAQPTRVATGIYAAIAELGSARSDLLPPNEWARTAGRALGFDDLARSPRVREVGAAAFFSNWMKEFAAHERRRGRLDLSREWAERVMALALLVLARHPEDPESYVVLARAYEEIGKNAWRIHDMPLVELPMKLAARVAIERSLRNALGAIRQALERSPDDSSIRDQLEWRQRKLDRWLHPSR